MRINSNDSRLQDNCSVCQEPLKTINHDRDLMLNETCSHIFHKTCLKQVIQSSGAWNKKCPTCREPLSNVSILRPNSMGSYEKVEEITTRTSSRDAQHRHVQPAGDRLTTCDMLSKALADTIDFLGLATCCGLIALCIFGFYRDRA